MVWPSRGDGCAGATWKGCPEVSAILFMGYKAGSELQLVPEWVCCGMGTGMHGQAGREEYLYPGFVPSLPHRCQGCDARGAAPLCFL